MILHFNVGQGDATLVIAPSGETILIDGGDKSRGRDVVTQRLRVLGFDKIDYIIASHFDADHIGGLDDVGRAASMAPRKVLDRRQGRLLPAKSTKAMASYKAVYSENRKTPLALGPGLFKFDSDLKILVTSANGCVYGKGYVANRALDENAASLSIALNYGDFDYFTGGDLTGGGRSGQRKTADLETPTASVVGKVDVLRLNHHGSETSSNDMFLKTLDPGVVIVSVGNGGQNKSRYHHPRRSVLDRLHEQARRGGLQKVYMTNRGETDGGLHPADADLLKIVDGDIVVVTNGSWFLVNGVLRQTDGQRSGAERLAGRPATGCTQIGLKR